MKRGIFEIVELLEDQLQRRHFLVVGLADDDRRVAAGERGARFLGEFDRARTIDEGEALVHELGGGDIELDAHAMCARFRRRIADRRLVGDLALALDGAECGTGSLREAWSCRSDRAHECDAPRTLTFSAICRSFWTSLLTAPMPSGTALLSRGNPVGAAPRVLCLLRFAVVTSGNRKVP